jgi:hypothetical protein
VGEIKSTIDLVMEKTKGLSLSEEEKRHLKEEEEARKAQVHVKRYLKGDLDLEQLLDQGRASSKTAQKTMIHALVEEGLKPGRESFSRALSALERWNPDGPKSSLKRLKDFSLMYAKALQKQKRKVKAQLWEELAARGVEGSAVEPNVLASPLWEETLRKMEREVRSQLEGIREEVLRDLLGSLH